MNETVTIEPGMLRGTVTAPVSKSSLHRLLIASFLAGEPEAIAPCAGESEDIAATRRCLRALGEEGSEVILDCGESGSTLRFLAPLAAALGKRPVFIRRGRLAQRPMLEYPTLTAGRHELAGNVSSQFVTGLLFSLPLLDGDSEICFTSPLESRGYVDMTLAVLRTFGIRCNEEKHRIFVPGSQRFVKPATISPEGDWSGAAFWFAANRLGSEIEVTGLDRASAQPDKAVERLLNELGGEIDVSQCPDLLPALAVAAAGAEGTTVFIGAARLRIKESDRLAAMESVLGRLGVKCSTTADTLTVCGAGAGKFKAAKIETFADHRIAMAAAVAATRADGAVVIDNPQCTAKSYPDFFELFNGMRH